MVIRAGLTLRHPPRIGPASIRVGADDLAAAPRTQGPPGLEVHGILDESHGSVAEADVDAAGVEAIGRRGAVNVHAPGVDGIVLALAAVGRADVIIITVDV